jgi:hypothetical protein
MTASLQLERSIETLAGPPTDKRRELKQQHSEQTVTRSAGLTLRSDHADPNGLALAFGILQPCLFRLRLVLEKFRQGCKLTADVLEKQPSLDDFGHENL